MDEIFVLFPEINFLEKFFKLTETSLLKHRDFQSIPRMENGGNNANYREGTSND